MGRVLPILFNTDMVRAILDGRKTVTRRVCKDGDSYSVPDMEFYDAARRTYGVHSYSDLEHKHTNKLSIVERPCPICPDDILYVRETWKKNMDGYSGIDFGGYIYKADCRHVFKDSYNPWHPSIHMPKEAARIWLKVTDVRVERLQEITEEQAIREGIGAVRYDVPTGREESAALEWFPILWGSTIKKADIDKYGWKANPWVWVIEFERCGKPEE